MLYILLLLAAAIHVTLTFFGGIFLVDLWQVNPWQNPWVLLLLSLFSAGSLAYLPICVRLFMVRLPVDEVNERRSRRGRGR